VDLLRATCSYADTSDAPMIAEWQAARAKLGPPIANAGVPQMQGIPAAGQAHLQGLIAQPWIMQALQSGLAGAQFQMVELDPLLAFQFTVDKDRSDHHNGGPNSQPSEAQVFEMCLPHQQVVENVRLNQGPNSLLINSRGLNFQPLAEGMLNTPFGHFVGMHVGLSIPLMHVVRFNGRCYLHNGFHRAVGLSRRGVKFAPCIVRDVPDAKAAGINPPHTFSQDLLESANPPTVGHFANGLAHDVMLKVFTRTLHVTWANYVTTED